MSWDARRFDDAMAELALTGLADEPVDAKARKRRRILEVATALFLKYGYRRTSIDDVARGAGVGKGTVYLYFSSKADLLMHAAAFEKVKVRALIVPVLEPDLSPRERLRRYIETAFVLVEHLPLVNRITSTAADGMHHVLQEISADMRERFERAQAEFMGDLLGPFAESHGWSKAELDERVAVFVSVIMSAATLLRAAPTASLLRAAPAAAMKPADFGRLMAEMLIEGLA